MSPTRQLVTLYPSWSLRELGSTITHLDIDDAGMLRETLMALVKGYKGTLDVDLSWYRIRVRDLGADDAPSTIRRWCGITGAGRTSVTVVAK